MNEIIKVETKEQLQSLYNCSAMTWEGLAPESFNEALAACGQADAKGYVTTGKVMNKICKLTGSNAYPDELNIFSIDRYTCLAFTVGARWMDDIIDNNARRQKYRPFKK